MSSDIPLGTHSQDEPEHEDARAEDASRRPSSKGQMDDKGKCSEGITQPGKIGSKSNSEEDELRDAKRSDNSPTPGATEEPPPPAESSSARKYEISSTSRGASLGDTGGPEEFDEYSEDDTEVSSEAVVDDIELILMPEEVEDLPPMENAPKLVRVTELNSTSDFTEEEFLKMDDTEEQNYEDDDDRGANDEGDEEEPKTQDYDDEDYDEEEEDEVTENDEAKGRRREREDSVGDSSSFCGKVHSGVQTDITALEKDGDEDDACFSEGHVRFDWRRRKTLTLTGVGLGASGNGGGSSVGPAAVRAGGKLGTPRGKKLNWKSELTLLPSKTKIGFPGYPNSGASMDGSSGFGAFSYAGPGYSIDSNYPSGQYSSRVAKFTSQENMTSSNSQFLKPSTLYRTRNLSRNLNHFASSETTFMQDQPDSPRFQPSSSALSTSTNFKGSTSVSSNQICQAAAGSGMSSARRRPSAKNLRQSLPDLSSPVHFQDNNKRRQIMSGRSGGSVVGRVNYAQQTYSTSFRIQKRSSSDDETSSLIDESERCLRSSIDLLLTDDYPSPGYDYPYLPRSSAGASRMGQQSTSAGGYYSARRSCSQPILTEQGLCGEPRDSPMGSPFLPRTLKDMRCSRWAKVILPNGLVAVVCVKETDEVKDCLTVNTETGCVVTIPFRKVVFAWRIRR